MLGTSLILAAISFVDDLRSLPASIRFGCHGLAAIATLAALGWPELELGLSAEGLVHLPRFLGLLLSFLWIAGYTNAFNFMDGINGLAGGQAVVTGVGMALLAVFSGAEPSSTPVLLTLVEAGASLGFLPYNFPQARMFMGDVGSAPLGFILSALVLWLAATAGWWLLMPLALLHANFVLDTGITLARRVLRGECWHAAHREHFYQRLIRSGRSHRFVTGIEMTLQCVVLGLMILYIKAGLVLRTLLIAAVIVLWLGFYGYCERAFRRSNYPKPGSRERQPQLLERL
jgi:UDP-N-acetylmuramyl pentapeptide phosphotransferase/UDP-N-acetylglucosamine-1-phosphate transferase